MSNKINNLKEQFRQALISTAKVISDDYKLDVNKIDKKLESKKIDFLDISSLSSKADFIKLRAESDSVALKKKFSNRRIYNKNEPDSPSSKSLYKIAEKIRYEVLGGKMLKGIKKNLNRNYKQKIDSLHLNQLKNKDDVPIEKAFELYMLNKFFNLDLNPASLKMLSFWEKDFSSSIDKHIEYLNKNLEEQNNYSKKFLEIFKSIDALNSDNEKTNEDNDDKNNEKDNETNDDDQNQSEENEENNKQDKSQSAMDVSFDLSDQKMGE